MEPITIAAIITAASTIGAGAMSAGSNANANSKNLEMAMLNRKDTLAAQKQQNVFTREELALKKRAADSTESQVAFNQKEVTEQKGYNRMQTAYERAAKLLSDNMNLNQAKAAPFQKYAGRA